MLRCNHRIIARGPNLGWKGTMAELRLVFQPAPDATMTVRVDFSSAESGMRGGGQPQPFTFQLHPEDYANIRWYLEEFMDLPIGGFVLRANHIEQSLIQWGHDLYKAVIGRQSCFQ